MKKYNIDFLIENEDSIDWNCISTDSSENLSLLEIRLFKHKINWKLYFENHILTCNFTTMMLEEASKYFTEAVYRILETFNLLTEDFLLKHQEKFNINRVIENCKVSEETLLKLAKKWIQIPNIYDSFKRAKYINLENPEYKNIKLIFAVN